MSRLYTTNGKQVLLAGAHFADGVSEGSAEIIAKALNGELAKAGALYEALEKALEYWAHRQQRYKNRHPAWVQEARAALASARGEAPPVASAALKARAGV